MAEDVLPLVPYRRIVFTIPVAMRRAFLFDRSLYGACSGSFETIYGTPALPTNHPTYIRLTRRGNVIRGWASEDPAVENDPTKDSLWVQAASGIDWGPAAPQKLIVGFANSQHLSGDCAIQTVRFKLIRQGQVTSAGKAITWSGIPTSMLSSGLFYNVEYRNRGPATLNCGGVNILPCPEETIFDGCLDEWPIDVDVIPVPVTTDPATSSPIRTVRPTPATAIVRGATFWLEIWATDRGHNNTGLTSVYVDVSICEASQAKGLSHGATFTQFATGTISQAGVGDFGGSALPNGGGIEPQWVRVGWIEMRAGMSAPSCTFSLSPSTTGIATFQRGQVDAAATRFGSASLAISTPSMTYDLDGSGAVGVGDLARFAGSWLLAVPSADGLHDFDCDDFVGPGDLSWFATAWQKGVDDPSILYPPCALQGGGGQEAFDVQFRIVALASSSPSDAVSTFPASLTFVMPGNRYFLEVWASDVGDINTGLTSAYVDLTFPESATQVMDIQHTPLFDVFPSGTIAEGSVDELGGSNLQGAGIEPSWARLAVLEMKASESTGTALHSLIPSGTGLAALGRGVIPAASTAFDSLTLQIGGEAVRFVRGDANSDGTNDISDGIGILSFLFTGGEAPSCEKAAVTNDDSALDISDAVYLLGHLFLGGKAPPEPLGACGGDPTQDGLTCERFPACE